MDVESWPRWIPTFTDVKRLDAGPLKVGSRARIKQPGMPVLVWEVTELDEGSHFTWVTHVPGVATAARHDISETADEAGDHSSACHLTLSLTWSGPLAGVVAALNAKRARQSLVREANGLKAASEAPEP